MTPPSDLPHPRHLLSMTFNAITEVYIQQQRSSVKRTLHGAFRTHMQNKANLKHMDVLNAHNSKQLGKVIQLLTDQPSQHCDLQTLHCPTEGQISDHFRVHVKVTEFFANWYQAPTEIGRASCRERV
jgi:hypothetical protein